MMLQRLLAALSLLGLLTACSSGGSSAKVISLDISGTVRYEDKLYDPNNGFTGVTVMKAVRHAKVELVGDQGIIATAATDDFGAYTLSGSGSNLYVRVLAQTDGTGAASHPVEVANADNPSQLYAIRSATLGAADPLVDIDITLASVGAAAGVFNILDVYQSASEFTYATSQGSKTGLPLLQVRWAECSTNGTYTSSSLFIALVGVHSDCSVLMDPTYLGGVDTDEYDDDVMWHEYAHYLEFALGTIDSPGLIHYLNDLHQDLRLAWSEGWGDFISGAIKQWLVATYPERLSIDTALIPAGSSVATSWYVDTRGTAVLSYDFRTGSLPGPITLLYASNEGAIAKILWGINDDALFDLSTIWGVFANRLTQGGVTANLEAVWDGWLAEFSPVPTDKSAMRAILNDREVYYEEDLSEVDDTTVDAKPLRPAPAFYTLFSNDGQAADFDLVSFPVVSGNSYRIETYNLHNGADTFLQILDSGGNPVAENDNYTALPPTLPASPNDTCTFSSRVELLTIPANDTYYAKVSSSTSRPAATGRLGDYQLAITENPTTAYQCP